MRAIEEAKTAIGGVLRFTVFDRTGLKALDGSREGCARSFWACVLALPAFYIPLFLEIAAGNVLAVVLSRSIGYVIGCVAFPLAAAAILRWLGRMERWPMLVYGYNWLSLVQNWAVLVLVLLEHAGLFGDAAAEVYSIFYVACLAVEGFMFTLILDLGVAAPVALVLIDLVLGEMIDGIARSIA